MIMKRKRQYLCVIKFFYLVYKSTTKLPLTSHSILNKLNYDQYDNCPRSGFQTFVEDQNVGIFSESNRHFQIDGFLFPITP